jgi:integrase
MSVYSVKRRGWRFDFTLKGTRYTKGWFKTKTKAKQEEAKKREELKNPPVLKISTDMDFLTLVNKRLDYVKNYNSAEHFRHVLYHARRWIKEWKDLMCSEISNEMVETYIIKRSYVSPDAANKEIRYLRALFNYGFKRKLILKKPTDGIDFLPVEKKKKYIPPKEDVLKVVNVADPDTQDYLWTIVLTAARVNEINSLTWDNINFKERFVTLWTSKKRHGNRESREVPMIKKLYDILYYRFQNRNPDIPWVFYHRYWSRKIDDYAEGPYIDRKKIMKTLCEKANVRYFRFHPFRHLTASILDDLGVPIGIIQRILGHENRKTTEGYLHSVGEAERNAMQKLESVDLYSSDISSRIDKPINKHKEYWLRKAERPDYNTLCRNIKTLGFVGTGKKYDVSDNAVRKWKKNYELQFEN